MAYQEFNKNRTQNRPGGRRRSRPGFRDKKDEFDSKLLDLSRVSHTREGGKQLRFRAVMVVGDKKGRVGVGVASGLDVAKGIEKATKKAKKSIITVEMVGNTIPHQVEAKFGAAKILLKPQKEGRGLVAGGTVRVVCTLAGIKEISSKVLGTTRNKLNNARATIKALKKLKPAKGKNKKLKPEKKEEETEKPKEPEKK